MLGSFGLDCKDNFVQCKRGGSYMAAYQCMEHTSYIQCVHTNLQRPPDTPQLVPVKEIH